MHCFNDVYNLIECKNNLGIVIGNPKGLPEPTVSGYFPSNIGIVNALSFTGIHDACFLGL